MVRKIRAKLVLQLRAEGLSGRAIAGIARNVPEEHHGGAGGCRCGRCGVG